MLSIWRLGRQSGSGTTGLNRGALPFKAVFEARGAGVDEVVARTWRDTEKDFHVMRKEIGKCSLWRESERMRASGKA